MLYSKKMVLKAICEEYQKDLTDMVGNITPEKLNITSDEIQLALNKLYYEGLIDDCHGNLLMSSEGVVITNTLWPSRSVIANFKQRQFLERTL